MILSIIGIVLGVTAIGLFIWLKKDQKMSNDLHEGDLIAAKHAYEALMSDFNNYQVETDRKIAELGKQLEIKAASLSRNHDKLKMDLPNIITKVIGHIEFAQDTINRKM
jgi:hypothetical protein